MAFHQVELHPQSRDITTFSAPNGLYRHKSLVFGLNMASEKFNHTIRQVVQDCPGAFNIHDDLIVGGVDDKQHDEIVIAVGKKFAECGLTFNLAKLVFKIRNISFMGHTMSHKGLQVTDDNIKAMAAAPEPKNAVEVKSVLGSALFSAKFIPDFATITQPLWELAREKTEWKWTEEEQTAFDEVKRRLTTAPIMAYYSLDADTRIVTDASPDGVGAVLQQKKDDRQCRPIYYASRKLRDVETRYFQIEREALAVKWSCDKFHLYPCGREFEIHNDHKTLIQVYGGQAKPPNARLERWLLTLQQYSFKIKYIPGWQNSADSLSRLPVEGNGT